jgi:hypothetical protein
LIILWEFKNLYFIGSLQDLNRDFDFIYLNFLYNTSQNMGAGKSVSKSQHVYSVNAHGAHLMHADHAQLAVGTDKLFYVHSRALNVCHYHYI